MSLYIFLLVLAGISALATFVALIFFIVKKRKKYIPITAIFFSIFVLASIFCSYKVISKTVNYVKSDAAQQDLKKASSKVGETIGTVASGTAEGLNRTLDAEEIKTLSKKTGEVIGAGLIGISESVIDGIDDKPYYISKKLEEKGFAVEKVKLKSDSIGNHVDVTVPAMDNKFHGYIFVNAYNSDGKMLCSIYSKYHFSIKGNEQRFDLPKSVNVNEISYFILTKE